MAVRVPTESPSFVELDDLAYHVATTYGEKGYEKCWEASIGFEDVWDEPRWGQRDEQAYLRLATSGLWTLAYLPTREVGQRGTEFDAQAWLRTDAGLFRVKADDSIKYTPRELAEDTSPSQTVRSPISIRRAKIALEIMDLRLSGDTR